MLLPLSSLNPRLREDAKSFRPQSPSKQDVKKQPSNEGEGWGGIHLLPPAHPCASVGILGFIISIFKR